MKLNSRKLLSIILTLVFLGSALPTTNMVSNAVLPTAMATQETDATMLAEELPNKMIPKSMLVYTEFADHDEGVNGELKNTLNVVRDNYLDDYHIDNLTDYTELSSVIMDYDVFLIPEQEDLSEQNGRSGRI